MNEGNYKTFYPDVSPVEFLITCMICGESIPTLSPKQYPTVCKECKRRLMLALYPEREEAEP